MANKDSSVNISSIMGTSKKSENKSASTSTNSKLEKARNKEKEEEKKALDAAKKDSSFKAGQFNQAGLRGAQAKQAMILYPILGVIALFAIYAISNMDKFLSIIFKTIGTGIVGQ